MQILNLILSEEVAEFLISEKRKAKFNRISDLVSLVKILEKFREDAKFSWSKKKTKKEQSIETLSLYLRKELGLPLVVQK